VHQLVAEFQRIIAADLVHPALAVPFAAGIQGVSAYLVHDFVSADSLDLVVREFGPAPPADALRVSAQLAGALDFAAVVNISHGALHPRDVLLSSDDTRLTGIGVVQALERVGVAAPVRRPYSAPERIAGGPWDQRADVFSLATLIHELLWGRKVNGLGAQAAESLTAIEGGDLPALRATFSRALAQDPAARFDTALDFAQSLKSAFPGVVASPLPAPKPKEVWERQDDTLRVPLDAPLHPPPITPSRPVEIEFPIAARAAEEARYRDVGEEERYREAREVEAAAPALIEFERGPSPTLNRVEAHTPTPHAVPAPAPVPPIKRSRSSVWPLALATMVGLAVGFASGYSVGNREQPAPIAAAAPAATTPPQVAAGREFTEATVVPPAAPEIAPAPKPDAPSVKPVAAEPTPPSARPTPPSASAKPDAESGRLLVRSTPTGARVFVDGRDEGRTPIAVRDLTPGVHRLRVLHDGYIMEERRVVISPSRLAQSVTVELARPRGARGQATAPPGTPAPTTPGTGGSFAGTLTIDSRPPGAKAFLDGTPVGTTPVLLPSVRAGSHVVRLEHDGYRLWSSSVRVVSSERNRVTASLEK